MSDITTFFPAGGGGEGAGINSYAPYKVNETVNDNPQGYNYATGLYTNPVDESVWLKTGKIIKDTVSPDPYPNAFKNPVATDNVEIRELNQTGVAQSSVYMALAADYRVGYKNYYLLFNRTSYTANAQLGYKLDSTGTLIGSSISIPDGTIGFNNMQYAEPIGAGFSASGNSNNGSVWIIYADVGAGALLVLEYTADLLTILNQYNLGTTPAGIPSPQGNVKCATWCEDAKLIYFTAKGSFTTPVANTSTIYSWNPATSAYLSYEVPAPFNYQPYSNVISIGTNPLTGQMAIANFVSGQAGNANNQNTYTSLYTKPGTNTPVSPLVLSSPLARVGFPTPTFLAANQITWMNPTAVTGTLTGCNQSISSDYRTLPGGAGGPDLNEVVTAASVGDTTARTDSSGSGQPLFIKLK